MNAAAAPAATARDVTVKPFYFTATKPVQTANVSAQFRAGDTRLHHDKWKLITSDTFVLKTVAGASLEFDVFPVQLSIPRAIQFSDYEFQAVDAQISKFVKLGIVEEVAHCQGEFVSNIFARDKKDGSLSDFEFGGSKPMYYLPPFQDGHY